jgi:tetratricopeptide (TPR) repeat protein
VDKPERPNNHILETESSKFFQDQIPNEWYIDKPDHDYGIDFNVNIVINSQVTGLNFSVQLKSTKSSKNKNSVSITLKHSTLGLFNTRLEPILLIIYIQNEKKAYWYWYNDLDIDLTSSQKTFKIRIPKANLLSSINWIEFTKYVQNIFSIKTLVDSIKSLEYNEISNSEILAWKNYFSGNYENASFYFKNLLKDDPKNVILLEGLSHSQYMSYNYKEALYNINKAIDLSGKPSQYLAKACILAEDGIQNNIKGKIIEAKNLFKQFIEKNPNQELHHYNFANTLSRLGENEEALKHFKACLKLNPNNAQAWKNLGQVYYDLHKHKEELNCYNKALSINPNLSQALFSKGITLSHIFNKNKEALSLMMKALDNELEMLLNFPRGYFWLASVNEKLNNLKESLSWINKGLDHSPEDIYFLNFKSNLLMTHWKDNQLIKQEAVDFFKFRLELGNDYRSLYFLIIIQDLREQDIYDLIKKHISLFNNLKLDILEKCGISLKDSILFLLHYDKYLEFRHSHPLNRYLDHLISSHFSISSEFWTVLDLVFAFSFSHAIKEYSDTHNQKQIVQSILNGLLNTPNTIFELIPEENYAKEDAISIMTQVYLEFPTVVIREFGAQVGFIFGRYGLDKPDPADHLSEEWLNNLRDQVLIVTNKKLKLLKEE